MAWYGGVTWPVVCETAGRCAYRVALTEPGLRGETMAAPRVCHHCGRVTTGRCRACRAERYGADHRAERRQWQALINRGGINCYRCKGELPPGPDWHLDHVELADVDDHPTGRHPSHSTCNVAATR